MATNMICSTIVWATASASTPVHHHIQRQLLLINTIFRFSILKMAKANLHIYIRETPHHQYRRLFIIVFTSKYFWWKIRPFPSIDSHQNIRDRFFGAKINLYWFSLTSSLQNKRKMYDLNFVKYFTPKIEAFFHIRVSFTQAFTSPYLDTWLCIYWFSIIR